MPKAVPLDPDAQAFLTASVITDATITSAINTLVLDLKSYGIWSKMKAIYPFVGGTASTHKWNLKDPQDTNGAFRLTFSGGWTHSANGALPNGTNAFANTFLNTSTQLTLNSHSFGVYSRTNNTTTNLVYGVTDGTNFLTNNLGAGNFVSGSSSTNLFTYTANPSTSLIMASRSSSNVFRGFRAGVFLNQNTNSISLLPNFNFYLGARSSSNTAQFFNVHQLAFSFIGDGLSDTEAANLYTAVQNMQTTLNRNV
jgi:hypothetical protein